MPAQASTHPTVGHYNPPHVAAVLREVVNLRNEGRWVFLNTLFSVSEAVMYMQLVDRLDLVSGWVGGRLVAQLPAYPTGLCRTDRAATTWHRRGMVVPHQLLPGLQTWQFAAVPIGIACMGGSKN